MSSEEGTDNTNQLFRNPSLDMIIDNELGESISESQIKETFLMIVFLKTFKKFSTILLDKYCNSRGFFFPLNLFFVKVHDLCGYILFYLLCANSDEMMISMSKTFIQIYQNIVESFFIQETNKLFLADLCSIENDFLELNTIFNSDSHHLTPINGEYQMFIVSFDMIQSSLFQAINFRINLIFLKQKKKIVFG
jgi:hypothetical protein